jgi:hypothetical protein
MFLILLFVTTTEGANSYYTYNYSSFANALTNYDKYQMQTTGNATYASYWIKLFDAEGNIVKEEARDLTAIRA